MTPPTRRHVACWWPRWAAFAVLSICSFGIGADAALELWKEGSKVHSIPLTTLTSYLGPQSFRFNVSGLDVVVHDEAAPWKCDRHEEDGHWLGKVVLFWRKSWCEEGVEQTYRTLAKTSASMMIKVSLYNPPGMWYYMHDGLFKHKMDHHMVFAQVNDLDVQDMYDELKEANATGNLHAYRLVATPDENEWMTTYEHPAWICMARIILPAIYMATAVRAAVNLYRLLLVDGQVQLLDATHISMGLEMVRSFIVGAFLMEGMGLYVAWNIAGAFMMGLPGIGLFCRIMVALKWREVRHATRKNRPIKNALRLYPKTIAACTLLIFVDLRHAVYSYYGWGNLWARLRDAHQIYAATGTVVCVYLAVQGGKVLARLRNGSIVVSELDKTLFKAFRSMTVWMMFGAACSLFWIGVVIFQVMVTLDYFWTLENFVTYYMLIHYSLALSSYAYVMSLTPLAKTGGTLLDRFGKWLTMLDAATAAALLGETFEDEGEVAAGKLIKQGIASLKGILLSELTRADFESNRSEKTPVGTFRDQVDWFISHSWHDDPDAKWEMLTTLVRKFEQEHGREPVLWIDKFCIDQTNIEQCLSYLPVHLLLCKRMVVLAGSTYTSRLWCNWELFMCYGISHIPMIEVDFVPVGRRSLLDVAVAFHSFDIRDASCFKESDKNKMLEVIDKSPKGRSGFNATIYTLGDMVDSIARTLHADRRATAFQTASRVRLVELTSRQSADMRCSGIGPLLDLTGSQGLARVQSPASSSGSPDASMSAAMSMKPKGTYRKSLSWQEGNTPYSFNPFGSSYTLPVRSLTDQALRDRARTQAEEENDGSMTPARSLFGDVGRKLRGRTLTSDA